MHPVDDDDDDLDFRASVTLLALSLGISVSVVFVMVCVYVLLSSDSRPRRRCTRTFSKQQSHPAGLGMPSVMSQDELAEASSTIGVKEVGTTTWARCAGMVASGDDW